MSVGAVLSGLMAPSSAGFALQRYAALHGAQGAERAPAAAGDCGGCGSCANCRTDVTQAGVVDTVELSPAARAAAEAEGVVSASHGSSENAAAAGTSATAAALTPEEQQRVVELKQRDAEVRQHEQAHLAAAGQYAIGGPTYDYETGPDGKRYAVGGEVQIDSSPVNGDPAATIAKMQQVIAAALAPAEPSSQDRTVAANARAAMSKARAEQAAEQAAGDEAPTTPAAGSYDARGTAVRPQRSAELIDFLA